MRGKTSWLTALVLGLSGACTASAVRTPTPAPAEPASPRPPLTVLTAPSATRAAPRPMFDAASTLTEPPDAAQPSTSPSPPFVDAPAWPAAAPGARLKVTWVVHPARGTPSDPPESRRRHVEIVVRIGAVARRLDLKSRVGSLFPDEQSVCHASLPQESITYPKERDELAKLTFSMAGAVGYLVRRIGPDLLEVVEWAQDDGACPDGKGDVGPCPRDDRPLYRMHVPKNVPIDEAIIEVDGRGKETPFSCT